MTDTTPLCLSIDTASDVAGIALSQGRTLLGEVTWRAHQSHSQQLLPAVDWLLGHLKRGKDELDAVFVCLGPGSYAGMRVGLSSAKALVYALDASIVGVGRLEAEALPIAEASGGRVIPLQAAGRAELAWAAYAIRDNELQTLREPALSRADAVLAYLQPGDVLTGDVGRLEAETLRRAIETGVRVIEPWPSRVSSIARLGQQRLERGEIDIADALVPLYLRAPAIGPQPSVNT